MIEKIAKLLASAADEGATPAERATAENLAAKLLDKHGLDMVDIVAKADVTKKLYEVPNTKSSRIYYIYLAMAATKMVGCDCYRNVGRGPTRITFVGSEKNIKSAIELFTYLVKEATAALARSKKLTGGKGLKYNDSFLKGFGSTMIKRATEIQKASVMSTALVPVNREVKEFMAGEGVTTSKVSASDSKAFGAGRNAGNNTTFGSAI